MCTSAHKNKKPPEQAYRLIIWCGSAESQNSKLGNVDVMSIKSCNIPCIIRCACFFGPQAKLRQLAPMAHGGDKPPPPKKRDILVDGEISFAITSPTQSHNKANASLPSTHPHANVGLSTHPLRHPLVSRMFCPCGIILHTRDDSMPVIHPPAILTADCSLLAVPKSLCLSKPLLVYTTNSATNPRACCLVAEEGWNTHGVDSHTCPTPCQPAVSQILAQHMMLTTPTCASKNREQCCCPPTAPSWTKSPTMK